MTRETLAKLVLAAAVLAGCSYLLADGVIHNFWLYVLWKGSGVALLALYAALRARTLDGWLITAVMALGSLGDVLLETNGMVIGAIAFFAGHLVAIWLYWRNRRTGLSKSQTALAAIMVPAVILIAFLLPVDRGMALPIAFYATGLSMMASSAWISRFPRYWTGLGAVAFVVSDLLIFARGGLLAEQAWADFAVWALYFGGQLLIVLGVTQTLAAARR